LITETHVHHRFTESDRYVVMIRPYALVSPGAWLEYINLMLMHDGFNLDAEMVVAETPVDVIFSQKLEDALVWQSEQLKGS